MNPTTNDNLAPIFKGPQDEARTYRDITIHRGKRWYAECDGFTASIAHPRTIEIIEKAALRVARKALAEWIDVSVSKIKPRLECEVRGWEYIASAPDE